VRVKAIQDLAQLSDAAFFEQVAVGTALCLSNAKRIYGDHASLVSAERPRGAEILRLTAEEEASKVLILLDAVRCPRTKLAAEFGRQLQYFNDHLAKGIYAQYCGFRPATFGEIRRWVDLERKEFYLDGPNGVDWIFYNDILRRREETIYVDYVESEGDHLWHDPTKFDELALSFVIPNRNPVFRLVTALGDAGCLSSPTLAIMADVWRPLSMDDDLLWSSLREWNIKMLERMEQKKLLKTTESATYDLIVNEWLFPLYPLDLTKERIDKNGLRDIQQQWSP